MVSELLSPYLFVCFCTKVAPNGTTREEKLISNDGVFFGIVLMTYTSDPILKCELGSRTNPRNESLEK